MALWHMEHGLEDQIIALGIDIGRTVGAILHWLFDIGPGWV